MPSIRRSIVFVLMTLGPAALAGGSPAIPGAEPPGPVALVGATIHPVSGPDVKRGTVLFEAGRITAVGRKVEVPPDAQRVELRGLHVWPGLINAYGNLGLVEIKSVRGTLDYRETGSINPNVKAEVAVNPGSELIPVTRSGGVLLSLAAPSGGLISGTSALMQLDGWTWREMTLAAPVAMHVAWPGVPPPVVLPDSGSKSSDRDPLAELARVFDDARAYEKAREAPDPAGRHAFDARLEAMLPVLRGELPLVAAANGLSTIESAVAFARRQGVRLIVYGGYDAPHCAELLKTEEVPVITGSIHRLPRRRGDDYDAAYTLPERLRAAGVEFCISAGGTSASNTRNLPYQAATAVAHGLPRREALRAITLYPARMLGVADRVGSLEPGKDATLIVTDGDPLETPTHVVRAYVRGRQVDLSDRQKRLWEKYREKYRRLSEPERP